MKTDRKTIKDILEAKGKRPLTCSTAYTAPVAKMLSDEEFDIILVGDSLGMTIQGLSSTVKVSLEDVLYHLKCVTRVNESSFVVADMPFLTTDVSKEQTIGNAGLLIQKGDADAVKIEGGKEKAELIEFVVSAGIPVMGHIGLNPQKILKMGKFKIQGISEEDKQSIIEDAKSLEKAGCFSLVLECVPKELAKKVTESISIPTVGIGAGIHCDGQILVCDDIVGLTESFKPKFVKRYAEVSKLMRQAFGEYKKDVLEKQFPDDQFSY